MPLCHYANLLSISRSLAIRPEIALANSRDHLPITYPSNPVTKKRAPFSQARELGDLGLWCGVNKELCKFVVIREILVVTNQFPYKSSSSR
jgi:hypothetical protein